jgi:predicted Zn finger-like uncharacterized protein
MTMLTRCPHCDTVFRVTPQQLQQKHGKVRCGLCTGVFDGFGSLAAEPEAARPPSGPERRAPSQAAAEEQRASSPPLPAGTPAAAAAPSSPPVDPFELQHPLDRPRRRPIRAWAAASVPLVLLLLGQAAYAYRAELAAHYPGLKPALLAACEAAGCSVPLLHRPRLISIEASDLQIPDPMRPSVIQLTATLRSHAPHDVAYPALDLVLTDAQEHTLARRIFSPREYLGKMHDPAAGIAPRAEITVRLDLDTGDLDPSGFRLDLLAASS